MLESLACAGGKLFSCMMDKHNVHQSIENTVRVIKFCIIVPRPTKIKNIRQAMQVTALKNSKGGRIKRRIREEVKDPFRFLAGH